MSEQPSTVAARNGRVKVEPQWRLESLQIVNWGGFEGHRKVDFHPESTLLSGGSGTGKSTLLDAYTALMMPWKVPFNGASNDAGSGRARDEAGGQRTLLTYLRGKVGNTGGDRSAALLRGKGQTHMLSFDGRWSLGDLSEVMTKFVPSSQQLGRVLGGAVSGIRRHETYDKFSSILFSRLAIGANADGDHALELLARIQASKSFPSVNELYRKLVLDEPMTFADADRAIADFDKLEEMYQQMESDAEKAQLLADIPNIHTRMVAAQDEAAELDTFGIRRMGSKAPIHAWAKLTESRLVETAITQVVADKKTTGGEHSAVNAEARKLKAELGQARVEYNKHGGATLESLDAQIRTAEDTLASREDSLARLLGQTERLHLDLTTQAAFDAAQAAAAVYIANVEAIQKQESENQHEVIARQVKLRERRDTIVAELKSLEDRTGRIPKRLDDLRKMVAQASSIPASDLPFLAELIDIADGEEQWRLAVETVLGGDARRLLVPAERFEQFSASIDKLQLRSRITFAAVESDKPLKLSLDGADDPGQQRRLAGKLQFADHPFSGWIQRRLGAPGRNALCVENAADLNGDGFRVTLAGQTRNGTEGAHGRNSAEYVIGFSNASLVEELGVELDEVRTTLEEVDKELEKLAKAAHQQTRIRDAHKALDAYTWEQIDVSGAGEHIGDLTFKRDRIKNSSDKLAEYDALINELEEKHDDAVGRRRRLKDALDGLEERHGDLGRQAGRAIP